jgi:hypothetical protein
MSAYLIVATVNDAAIPNANATSGATSTAPQKGRDVIMKYKLTNDSIDKKYKILEGRITLKNSIVSLFA